MAEGSVSICLQCSTSAVGQGGLCMSTLLGWWGEEGWGHVGARDHTGVVTLMEGEGWPGICCC